MNHLPKPRVGKNSQGWFAAIPKWWGEWEVIEGHDTQEQAMETALRYVQYRLAWNV